MSSPFYAVVSPVGRLTFHATKPTLEDLQAAVGGDIEAFPAPHDGTTYLNEEGKLLGLAHNRLATHWLREFLLPGDWIAGPLVVTGPIDDAGDETALTAEQLADLRATFAA